MSANCIWVEDYDPVELWRSNLRRARKRWFCCECGDPIEPGDLYEHVCTLAEGAWEDWRTCARCANVADDFFRGRMLGGMVEYFEEEFGFDYRDGIPGTFTPCGK